MKFRDLLLTAALFSTFNLQPSTAFAQGTAFTYQGRLNDGNAPANGVYDLTFTLFAANAGGIAIAGAVTNSSTVVSNGLFTAMIDFGPGAFTGGSNWMEIGVRTNGAIPFSTLVPRQQITPAPYAVFAGTAVNLTGVLLNTSLPASPVFSGTVVASNFQSGVNGSFLAGVANNDTGAYDAIGGGFQNSLQQTATFNYIGMIATIGGGAGNAITNSPLSAIGGGGGNIIGPDLSIFGGYATIAGGNRNLIQSDSHYAAIGGGSYNGILAGSVGAAIAGGEDNLIFSNGTDDSIAGGQGNQILQGNSATIGGGSQNKNSSALSTIGGGAGNVIATNAVSSAIGGGENNVIHGAGNPDASYDNYNYNYDSTIGGGGQNVIQADAWGATISGGTSGSIGTNSDHAFIGGGWFNAILANDYEATISGGYLNTNGGPYATISGGYQNIASNSYAVVSGGHGNIANGFNTTVGGGQNNHASGTGATISGGDDNGAGSQLATVGGGQSNQANGTFATVGGGQNNTAINIGATVSGGYSSHAYGYSAVGGGQFNTAGGPSGYYGSAFVGGGANNAASGDFACIPGGDDNLAAGTNSFAAGHEARANYDGDFVWADLQNAPFNSTTTNQFLIRARGGVGIDTGTTIEGSLTINTNTYLDDHAIYLRGLSGVDHNHGLGYNGQTITNFGTGQYQIDGPALWGFNGGLLGTKNGGDHAALQWNATSVTVNGTFNNLSDRNAKQNFASITPAQILAKVAQLPLSEWSYKMDTATRHIGPMAQDFYAAFNVGTDDRHIAPVDENGVALAAIQGLNEKMEELKKELNRKDAENTELKQRLGRLEKLISDPADKH